MDVFQKLQEIFRDVLDDEGFALTREASSSDVKEWDSLAHITIIAACEAEFSIKFELNDIGKLRCVGDIIDMIGEKL